MTILTTALQPNPTLFIYFLFVVEDTVVAPYRKFALLCTGIGGSGFGVSKEVPGGGEEIFVRVADVACGHNHEIDCMAVVLFFPFLLRACDSVH